MASSTNKDNSMEYDKTMYKRSPAPKKNHLAGRLSKFQETINQTQAPAQPAVQRVHEQQELDPQTYNEVKRVYQIIKDNGQQGDYAVQLMFGELVPLYGSDLNKLIQTLSIAREHGYMNYSGAIEFLEPEKDDEAFIKLIKQPY